MHAIILINQTNRTMDMYSSSTGAWTAMTYTDSSSSGYTFQESDAATMQPLPNRTIAGKTCTAYRITYKSNGTQAIIALWQGFMMYSEDLSTGVIMEATAVTLNVPATAFSKESIEVTWL
jgi:hypothetical protein